MKCPSCQTENRETARFCRNCGMSLAPATPPVAAPPDDVVAEPAQPMVAQAEAAPPEAAPSEMAPPEPALPDATPLEAELNARIQEAQPLAAVPAASGEAAEPEPAPGPEDVTPAPAASPEEMPAPVPVLPAFQPLEPGTKVAGRFEIVQLLAAEQAANVYAAVDFAACPVCGAVIESLAETYCNNCGFELSSATARVSCRLREALSQEALGVNPEATLTHGDRYYAPIVEEAPEPAIEPAAPETTAGPQVAAQPLALRVGYASHVGMIRPLDEDSLCAFTLAGVYESVPDPLLGLFIVADGMGGHEGGEVASKLAVQHIAEQLIKRVLLPYFSGKSDGNGSSIEKLIRKAVEEANKEIFDLAQARANDMGCTLTMALVANGTAYIANVGDSRTYLMREGHLRQVTADHSLVASLVKAGVIEPADIFTHPERNVIYRSLGTKAAAEVDIFVEPLAAGDALVVCCDGLWEAIRDEGIEDVLLTTADPQAACAELVRRSNQAGGEDNISVIVVRVDEPRAADLLP